MRMEKVFNNEVKACSQDTIADSICLSIDLSMGEMGLVCKYLS